MEKSFMVVFNILKQFPIYFSCLGECCMYSMLGCEAPEMFC